MLADSQIRLIQQSPGHIVAYDPPYVLFGTLFILFGLMIAGIMTYVSLNTGWRGVNIIGFAVAATFLVIGIGTATSRTYISVSTASGELALSKQILGVSVEGERVPLKDIELARVQDVKNLHRVVLVLRSGKTMALTSATDRDGYDHLANAINGVLLH